MPTAIVTGASKGIGRAVAVRLASEYEIVAVARSHGLLEALQREIEGAGGRCRTIALDLADPAAVDKGLAGIEADVLVNNAGVGMLKPFVELTREEWQAMVNVNFNALFEVTRAVLPAMIRRHRGHIVIIGSIAGRGAFVGGTCYAATKHAAIAFAESLMLELRTSDVKVSVVNPGSVASEFSERSDPSWMLAPEEVAEAVAQVLATPADVLVHRLEIRPLRPPKSR